MNKFTIIIPHHGLQEQLDRCTTSIPDRDDVQTIVVMDDECRGAGWARNRGLEQATGDYVIFSDSDDFFLDSLSEFLDDYKDETADMVIFNACCIDEVTKRKSWRANHLNSIIGSNDKEWQERHIRYHFTEPWCRLIKLSFIKEHGIKFGESKIANDVFFATQVGLKAKKIKIENRTIYCICNNASSTAKRKSDDRILDATRQIARSNILLLRNGITHYHSRMLRPFFTAILNGKFRLAGQCITIMKDEGYGNALLFRCFIHYPIDLCKLLRHKIIKREFI